MSRTPLAGARVLVTGGTRGVGRRLALGAAERGAAEVVIWARDPDRGEQVRAEIGPRARFLPVDVTDAGAVAVAAAETGPVDVLVHSAGTVVGKPFLELTEEDVQRTFQVNTLALYRVTRAFLPGMVERNRGTIVTMASAAGMVGPTRLTAYAGSKHAAVGFNEALRAELRGQRSRVNTLVVCPFYIDTGMFSGVRTRFPWLLPILREGDVAKRILDAIESGRQTLVLPGIVRLVGPLHALPAPLLDGFVDLLGVNHTMDGFVGRPEAEQRHP